MAAVPWVRWIEREPAEELLQAGAAFEPDDSRELVCASDGSSTGAGVVVGVRDNGLYWNGTEHVDFAGRIAAGSDTSVNAGHGTHVTGIILGGGTIDLAGAWDARGVAPGASVLFQTSAWTYPTAFAAFAANGVQLSNHSWGFTSGYGYDSDTQAIDDYADDGDMILVFAAGNDGPNTFTTRNPATGKNVISVGAVRYLTDDALPSGVTAEGTVEKMIVKAPRSGTWTALVDFGPRYLSSAQNYSLYVMAILEQPALGLTAALPHANPYLPGEAFSLPVTARNTGGWIAAGVTAQVDWALAGLPNTTRFVDSLVCDDASKSISVGLTAPTDWGTYDFSLILDGLNRGLASISQPFSIQVCDQVTWPSQTLPANGASSCDATPTFEWSALTGAPAYRLQVDDDVAFGSPAVNVTTANYYHTPGTALPAGFYYWRLRGESAACQGHWSAVRSLTIQATPAAPALYYPASGGEVCGSSPYLSWNGVSGATSYQIQVDNSTGFSSPEIDLPLDWSYHMVGAALAEDTYYWRVRSCNDCGCGAWPATWSLTIGPPGSAPALASPASGSQECTATPGFAWSPVSGTVSYELQVDADPDFSSPLIDATTPATGHTSLEPLPPGLYHWRVQAGNACGLGPWATSSFSTATVPDGTPALSSPEEGGEVCQTALVFSWSGTSQAWSYQLQVDDNPTFDQPELAVEVASPATEYAPGIALQSGSYHWRVRACNGDCCGAWSPSRVVDVAGLLAHDGDLLLFPVDGSSTCDATPAFAWAGVPGAVSYEIEVDDDAGMASPEIQVTTSGTTHIPASALAPGAHLWHVRPCNACGCATWSTTWALDLGEPATPALASPADGQPVQCPGLTFGWLPAARATHYTLQVDDDPAFASPNLEVTQAEVDLEPGASLPSGTYHWRVQAGNACGNSPWSAVWTVPCLDTVRLYLPLVLRHEQ